MGGKLGGTLQRSEESVVLHCASAEDGDEHEFLPQTQVQLNQFRDRNEDDIDVHCNVVSSSNEPEDWLVDAVIVFGLIIPGCPDGCLVGQSCYNDTSWFILPDIGLQAKVIGSPKATGNSTDMTIPAYTSFLVRCAGKIRKNIKRKHSLLKPEEMK